MQLTNSTLPQTSRIENTAIDPKWLNRISLTLVTIGSLVFLGWELNVDSLKSLLLGAIPMKSNTALTFILIGLSLWLSQNKLRSRYWWIIQLGSFSVFLIGGITLLEHAFGVELGIDHLLLFGSALSTANSTLDRMSAITAFAFLNIGSALFLTSNNVLHIPAQLLALLASALGFLSFAGYLFSSAALYSVHPFSSIALPTTVALFASGIGVLLMDSKHGFMCVIAQPYSGGVMARRLLPALLVIPTIIGWLRLQGQYLGYYTTEFGLAVFLTSTTVILILVVWWTARSLNQIDVQHQQTTQQLELYAKRMTILHNIDQGTIGARPVHELVKTTLKELRTLIPCERIGFNLVDDDTQEIVSYAVDTSVADPFVSRRVPLTEYDFSEFDQNNTRYIPDLRLLPAQNPYGKMLVANGFYSLFQIILTQDKQPIGTLNLFSNTVDFFTPEYREITQEVANQLAIVVNQLRLSQNIKQSNVRLERYARRMEILHRIDFGIINAQAIPDLINPTLSELRQLIPCQEVNIGIIDEITNEWVIYAAVSDRQTFVGHRVPSHPDLLKGFDDRNMCFTRDIRLVIEEYPFAKQWLDQGLVSLLQVILKYENKPIGALSLMATTTDFFTDEYCEIALEVANQLAIAIHHMQLSEDLQKAKDTLEQRIIERTAELTAAKEKVEAILDNSLDGILLAGIDLRIEQANPAFEKLFGRTINVPGKVSLLDIVYPEDVEQVEASVQEILKGSTSSALEVRTQRQDGTTFDAELSIGHVAGDGLVTTIHDITNRKLVERQLRYQASIQSAVADAVITTDLDLRIQSWNEAAERLHGWSADEVIGKSLLELLPSDFELFQSIDELERAFNENGYWTGELRYTHRNGEMVHILSSSVLFKDTIGEPLGVLIVNHDITSRKQAEEALHNALEQEKEVNEMKTRFISIASHEFRTPLASIFATAESLSIYRHKMQPEQIESKLDKIRQQVTHLTAIMDDVLESARMQGVYLNFKPVMGSLDLLCHDVIQELTEQSPERIRYTCDTPLQSIRFDPRLMRQIITNLLSNALKYSLPGKPIEVKLVHTDRHVILDVSDQGIGIPEADLNRIFEPFHRAGNVGSIVGTGLGLSITKKAVELHGGTIECKSVVGQGTTFTVVIPIPSE